MGIQISLPMMAFLVLMTGFAGFVDSAAGGGGLISLPAYLFAGLPPHYTYATNKFSAACGTTFATASFFRNGAMNVKVGIGIIGLGSDFDGIGGKLEMDDCSKLPLLAEALRREGFTEDEVEDIFYRNARRFFEENL